MILVWREKETNSDKISTNRYSHRLQWTLSLGRYDQFLVEETQPSYSKVRVNFSPEPLWKIFFCYCQYISVTLTNGEDIKDKLSENLFNKTISLCFTFENATCITFHIQFQDTLYLVSGNKTHKWLLSIAYHDAISWPRFV